MEGMYAIWTTPQSLTEPGPVGWVMASSLAEARRFAARVIKLGFYVYVV